MNNVVKHALLSNIIFSFVLLCLAKPFVFCQGGVIKTIVIDAGHGGKDPGCHGNFSNEKEVCLDMALKLGAKIKKKYPNIKVIYTRDKDVFVELLERANIANRAKADLFICIHANAATPAAYGSETYVLGLHRTDAQQKVMERENSIIELETDKGAKYKSFDMSPEAIIAMQLQGSVFRGHSIKFAENVQKEFKKIGRFDRGVKEAGFYVLYKTAMPSVLIETGFLTNPKEEKVLASEQGQNNFSSAMFQAFENYYAEMTGESLPETSTVIDNEIKPENNQTENKLENNTITPIESDFENSQTVNKQEKSTKDKVIFSVQIKTSSVKLRTNSGVFKDLDIFEYQQSDLYKYCAGQFIDDYKAASQYKLELREKGFNHAFTVAFLNGQRIGIEKALKLAKKN